MHYSITLKIHRWSCSVLDLKLYISISEHMSLWAKFDQLNLGNYDDDNMTPGNCTMSWYNFDIQWRDTTPSMLRRMSEKCELNQKTKLLTRKVALDEVLCVSAKVSLLFFSFLGKARSLINHYRFRKLVLGYRLVLVSFVSSLGWNVITPSCLVDCTRARGFCDCLSMNTAIVHRNFLYFASPLQYISYTK